jgi:hypothetical protein
MSCINLKFLTSVSFLLFLATASVPPAFADETNVRKEGYYVVIEGHVSQINAIMLVIDGQQYPLSGFCKVFMDDIQGQKTTLQMIAGVGKIDLARIYLLGGRVEQIVVLKNI